MWQAGARVGVIPAAPPVPGSPAFVLPLRFPGGQGAGVPQSLWRRLPCNHRPCTPLPPLPRAHVGRWAGPQCWTDRKPPGPLRLTRDWDGQDRRGRHVTVVGSGLRDVPLSRGGSGEG